MLSFYQNSPFLRRGFHVGSIAGRDCDHWCPGWSVCCLRSSRTEAARRMQCSNKPETKSELGLHVLPRHFQTFFLPDGTDAARAGVGHILPQIERCNLIQTLVFHESGPG